MELTNMALSFLAGALSTLSPCVLPLLPAILLGATAHHRRGPLALTAGLALSFAGIGLFVATIGYGLGLTGEMFRLVGGLVMVAIGGVLLVPAAQSRWALATGPLQTWAESAFGGISTSGPKGQFALGMRLGLVWAPYVGPTLGAASLLAAQGKDLGSVVATTLVFAAGAALPLLLLGMLSGTALRKWSRRLANSAGSGSRFSPSVSWWSPGSTKCWRATSSPFLRLGSQR